MDIKRISGWFAVFLFLALALPAYAQDYCAQAQQDFRAGNYAEAKSKYTACKAYLNKNTDSEVKKCEECAKLRQQADSYFNSCKYDKALKQYKALLEKNSSDPVANKNKPKCETEIAKADKAKADKAPKADKADKAKADKLAEEKEAAEKEAAEKERETAQHNQDAADSWSRIKNTNDITVLDNFLSIYGDTPSARQASERKAEIVSMIEENERLSARERPDRQTVQRPAVIEHDEPEDEPADYEDEAELLNERGKASLARRNYNDALRYFLQSAKLGSDAAKNNIGVIYEQQENYVQAARHYQQSAYRGFAEAQYNLGRLYQYGKGVKKNLSEARRLYREAAAQGLPEAEDRLNEFTHNNLY